MSYWGYAPYIPVAERRKKAERAAAKARKSGASMDGVAAYRGAIAKTFWGKAWCTNLESYSDFENRLPRGRTYVRSGAVIDLKLSSGEVIAQVMGSSLYTVKVSIAKVEVPAWQAISAECADSIGSLVELLQGKLSSAVMERICRPGTGLFPAPNALKFDCSCPDWADMCKHVAAALYGIGARLDQQPELLFALRGVDAKELVARAAAGMSSAPKKPVSSRVLDDASLANLFGLEMAESAVASVVAGVAPSARKAPAIRATKTVSTGVPKVNLAATGKGKITAKTNTSNVAKTAAMIPARSAKQTAARKTVKTTSKPVAKSVAKAESPVPPATRKIRKKSVST